MSSFAWIRSIAAGLLLAPCTLALALEVDPLVGQSIFRAGALPNGVALRGDRQAGGGVVGAAAACATCHRRSGLGTIEGRIVVPPIIGRYLFRAAATNISDPGLPHILEFRSTRDPYDERSLARAIRDGVNPNGRPLNYLMPRYPLDDADMASLIAYLKQLTDAAVPGVGDDMLHFATIITPGVDPAARQGMLDVMQQFIADKNAFIRGGTRPIPSNAREIKYRVTRRWQLHVWDLSGPAETWQEQLRAKLAAEPVFAVISGLGAGSWAPVHRFCELAQLPCLFPNVEEPPVAEQDFYPVYFSRGVWLEADLMEARLTALKSSGGVSRIVQVFREGDIGQDAARALDVAARGAGIGVENRILQASSGARGLSEAINGVDRTTALIFWLRPGDLKLLPPGGTAAGVVLVSGTMGGFEDSPVPADWRAHLELTYPIDLPDARKARMNFPLGWFRIHNIRLVAERVQVDTYVACGIVSEVLNDMLDSFVRDYLIERVESMLSHRLVNGYFPRLSLAPGQRFASKGGYIVRFATTSGSEIKEVTDWIVP